MTTYDSSFSTRQSGASSNNGADSAAQSFERERRLRDALPSLGWGTSAIFWIYLLFDLAMVSSPGMKQVALFDGLMAVFVTGLTLAVSCRAPSPRWSHPLVALVASLSILNASAALYVVGDPRHTFDLGLVLLVVSCFLFSMRYFSALVGLAFISWWAAMSAAGIEFEWLHSGYMLVGASVVAFVVMWVRQRSFLREFSHLQELQFIRNELERRTSDLERAADELEAQIRERESAENLLVQFVQNAPAPIAMFDQNMNYLLYSRRWIDDFDLDATELAGEADFSMFPPLRARWESIKNACLSGSTEQGEDEEGFLTRTGQIEWLRWEARPWMQSEGVVGGIILFVEFITERKNAERALQESEDRLQDFFDNANDLIQIVSPDGRLLYVNKAWRDKLGYEEDETAGLGAFEIVPDELKDEYQLAFDRVMNGETFENFEITFVARSGERIHVSGNLNCRYENGAPVAVRSIFRDISEPKRAQTELIRAKEEAEIANKTKSRFLAVMSHELRTPLNSIIGFSRILLKNKFENMIEQDLDYINRIRTSGLGLLALINDILDLSKIEAGRMDVVRKDVSLSELINQVVDQIESQVRQKEIEVIKEVPIGLKPIHSDHAKLWQILMNLVSNAVKFTDEGRVVIRIEADEAGAPQTMSVEDTGIGIASERLPEIFDSFQQVDEGAARKYGGTGLGLSITRSLCDLMGYRLEVHSEVDSGSKFTVFFDDSPNG